MSLSSARRVHLGLAVAAAAMLAACGSETKPTNTAGQGSTKPSADTASVTITSYPAAEAKVDGVVKGTTPLTLALTPGTHSVSFSAAGFNGETESITVKAGESRTVEGILAVTNPNDPITHDLLASAAEIPLEPATDVSTHRGASSGPQVLPMYPMGDVRMAGLSSFRVEIDDKFEAAGKLEFRKGKKVLWSAPFNPDHLVTVDHVPQDVLKALKTGDRIEWGFYPDNPKQKSVTSTFVVIEKKQVEKALVSIDSDKRLAKQPALTRDLLKAEKMENYSLYSEALQRYLDIRAAYADTALPYKGIANCLQRLHLTDSELYAEALSKKPVEKSPTRPARSENATGGGLGFGNSTGGSLSGPLGTGGIGTPNMPKVDMTGPGSQPELAMADPNAPTSFGDRPTGPDYHSGAKPPVIEGNADNAGGGKPLVNAMGDAPVGGGNEANGGNTPGIDEAGRALLSAQAAKLREIADKEKAHAQELADLAKAAQQDANAKKTLADQLKSQLTLAQNLVDATTPGTPEHQDAIDKLHALQEQIAAAELAAVQAADSAAKAQLDADAAKALADKAELEAKNAENLAMPTQLATQGTQTNSLNKTIADAKSSSDAAQAGLTALNKAFADMDATGQALAKAQADYNAALEHAQQTGNPADQLAADAMLQNLTALQTKWNAYQTAMANQSKGDMLAFATKLAADAKAAADQASAALQADPNNPTALALAQEAAQKAAQAADAVQKLLDLLPH
jgi:hypothetical protein